MNVIGRAGVAAAALTFSTAGAQAATVVYTSQPAFQAALPSGYTLINLDAAPFSAFTPGYRLDDAAPAAALAALGIDSVGLNAQVFAGQNFQTVTDRDRMIFNGQAFGGHIAFNFATPVNGIGGFSNNVDYGRVRLFSGANLTGTFLGEAQFGPGGFGGITSTAAIGSVQFTCDFNADLACGVFDVQFGSFAVAVPEPATWSMMIGGFGLAGGMLRARRRKTHAATSALA